MDNCISSVHTRHTVIQKEHKGTKDHNNSHVSILMFLCVFECVFVFCLFLSAFCLFLTMGRVAWNK